MSRNAIAFEVTGRDDPRAGQPGAYRFMLNQEGVRMGNYIFDSPNDPGYISTCRVGISRIDKPLGGSLAR